MRQQSIPFWISVGMVYGATLLLFGCTSPTEPTWFAPSLALERALDDWNPNGHDGETGSFATARAE